LDERKDIVVGYTKTVVKSPTLYTRKHEK